MSFSQKERRRSSICFKDSQSLTEQSHKESCDIHTIMRKARTTGIIEHVAKHKGQYGVMPTGNEYHQNMNIIAMADTLFESVPSDIRKKFDNDPAKYLDYMQDNNNFDEIEEMGLDTSHLIKPIIEPEKPIIKTDEISEKLAEKDE